MFVLDLLGALLTLITLSFLFLSGYLLAQVLLRERGETDLLAFAVAALLATTAEAALIGLALGLLGLLKIVLALPIVVAITLLLLRRAQRDGGDPWAVARKLGHRVGERVREHPALTIIAVHAVASEALRGLMRPPLSWDSIMYHVFITATWLQNEHIAPVFGSRPMAYYGYQPSGGSVWMWWWMAPSHSELYINLTYFPQAVLLALAVGGVARQLGARQHWPLAAFLTLLAPVVIRFAATQYADIFVASTLVAAVFFTLLWLDQPRWGTAILAGAGLGAAASAKVLGLTYAVALVPAIFLVVRGAWQQRIRHVAAAAGACALLGSPFYLQNIAAGVGALAARCDSSVVGAHLVDTLPTIPRPNSVADLFPQLFNDGQLLDTFLGISDPASQELGLGPQIILLLPVLLLPLAFPRGERRAAVLVWSQIVAQIAIWVTIPFASDGIVFANVRYMIGGLGLCFAGVVALAERRAMNEGWLRGVVLVLLVQDLLQLHAEMPRAVRLALAGVDAGVVTYALSSTCRSLVTRQRARFATAALALAILCAPFLSQYRHEDRGRAFATEFTTHSTAAPNYAGAWRFLDLYGGDGTVAVHGTPIDSFVYPAMGAYLERRALYVNVNRQDSRSAADYPRCVPRVDLDPNAWVENLAKQDVRWLHVSRLPPLDFPEEYVWANERPNLFSVRFQDDTNVIYEVFPEENRKVALGRRPQR